MQGYTQFLNYYRMCAIKNRGQYFFYLLFWSNMLQRSRISDSACGPRSKIIPFFTIPIPILIYFHFFLGKIYDKQFYKTIT